MCGGNTLLLCENKEFLSVERDILLGHITMFSGRRQIILCLINFNSNTTELSLWKFLQRQFTAELLTDQCKLISCQL